MKNKERTTFVVLIVSIIVSTALIVLGIVLYIQRGNDTCEAQATFQNTERNLWLALTDTFIHRDDTKSSFLLFIDANLPEVECSNGALITKEEN